MRTDKEQKSPKEVYIENWLINNKNAEFIKKNEKIIALVALLILALILIFLVL